MTEEALREILRDPENPADMRRLALELIVSRCPMARMFLYQRRLEAFRTQSNGVILPLLMVA